MNARVEARAHRPPYQRDHRGPDSGLLFAGAFHAGIYVSGDGGETGNSVTTASLSARLQRCGGRNGWRDSRLCRLRARASCSSATILAQLERVDGLA